MFLKYTETFEKWLKDLKDSNAKGLINRRLLHLQKGNAGDSKAVGDGVSELRIHYGCGYRVYFYQYGKNIIILLCGGKKSTQDKDIQKAKEMKKCLVKQVLN